MSFRGWTGCLCLDFENSPKQFGICLGRVVFSGRGLRIINPWINLGKGWDARIVRGGVVVRKVWVGTWSSRAGGLFWTENVLRKEEDSQFFALLFCPLEDGLILSTSNFPC